MVVVLKIYRIYFNFDQFLNWSSANWSFIKRHTHRTKSGSIIDLIWHKTWHAQDTHDLITALNFATCAIWNYFIALFTCWQLLLMNWVWTLFTSSEITGWHMRITPWTCPIFGQVQNSSTRGAGWTDFVRNTLQETLFTEGFVCFSNKNGTHFAVINLLFSFW